MQIRDTRNGLRHEVIISEASAADMRTVKNSRRFGFDWQHPTGALTLKLALKKTGKIVGLMSVTDRPQDLAIEINMLESSKENVGAGKQYDGVAGCLIAYTCREAFRKGYDGFVCLMPKTALEAHYGNVYGMRFTRLYMVVDGAQSYRLIRQYLE
jgi:hypothetical protein